MCEFQYVMTDCIVKQKATINKEGDVVTHGRAQTIIPEGSNYVYCKTHDQILSANETHFGQYLHEEWEVL